ncbi:hypothetical protein ABE288_01780 [Bacillus salipaludis]|uniref:hypothetical protein n=1 Tax=Bacillus salipaludis TaxID=2547811 RepID=UPI003D19DD2A
MQTQLHKEHLAIYEAIKVQDEEAAWTNMLIHLENVDAILGKYFQHTTKFNRE